LKVVLLPDVKKQLIKLLKLTKLKNENNPLEKPITHIASTVCVIVGTLHSISDLTAPGCLALELTDQVGVSVLKVVRNLAQNT